MRSADYIGHGHGLTVATGHGVADTGTDITPEPAGQVSGPFSFLDHRAMGLFDGEYAYFYRIPTGFDETATGEINGVQNGTASRFGPFEVHPAPQTGEFGDLDYGDFIGQEFGLPAGTYVGFIYRPDDLSAAHEGAVTDSFTVTLDNGMGRVVTSSLHTIAVPALDISAEVSWGPRSGPNAPNGSLDVTQLNAFTGSTFLPTGEVVFQVNAVDCENDDTFALTQPTYGTVAAIRSERGTVAGGPLGDANGEVIRLVYTPAAQYRTDPTVYTDSFTFQVDDRRGDVTSTTVPVIIAKNATVTATTGLPYTGTGSFSGHVGAPFDDVEGYVMVPAALLSESIDSLTDSSWNTNLTAFGSVEINDDGSFTYTRDSEWAVVPVDGIDDSFAIIAYTAHNQWAAALVPVGGAAMATYPSIIDIVDSAPTSPHDV